MNYLQIENTLSNDQITKNYFSGVFRSDQLPRKIARYPACWVCNVDNSTEHGTNEMPFYQSSSREAEFFYSYVNESVYFKGTV